MHIQRLIPWVLHRPKVTKDHPLQMFSVQASMLLFPVCMCTYGCVCYVSMFRETISFITLKIKPSVLSLATLHVQEYSAGMVLLFHVSNICMRINIHALSPL
jgi:hypothetical protein